jgi:2-hydroxyglutaryl-CoA dehydratase D-component
LNAAPRKITLDEWDLRYDELLGAGLREPFYGGRLSRHISQEGDLRLRHLRFDNSAAALRLWNFLLTESCRLNQARARGEKLVGTMKDLGTVPVMAYSFPNLRAFYPDGAWWTPCLMECSDGLLEQSAALGIDASFCPVRAMLPAFLNGDHFPRPDLLVCSTGAICDDFSAIAQRLERMGFPVTWWEMPRRRTPAQGEPRHKLPGGLEAPQIQVEWVKEEFERVGLVLGELAGLKLAEQMLRQGISEANRVRRILSELRRVVYGAERPPLPALEMLVAEMLAIHFCSDRSEAIDVLSGLLVEATARVDRGQFVDANAQVKVFWVNPVADLRVMNLLEECGGRICGADFMVGHALELIPEELPPLEALARIALADPMVGSAADRARHIVAECQAFGAEAVVISRIPGASHCAWEGVLIQQFVRERLALPTIELEVPPVADSLVPNLRSRLEALIETALAKNPRP